jgi:hypothetical protein
MPADAMHEKHDVHRPSLRLATCPGQRSNSPAPPLICAY